jgi:hypothetical protein
MAPSVSSHACDASTYARFFDSFSPLSAALAAYGWIQTADAGTLGPVMWTGMNVTACAPNTPTGGLATYTYDTLTGLALVAGRALTVTGMHAGNNGTFAIISFDATHFVVANASAYSETGVAGVVASQAAPFCGVANVYSAANGSAVRADSGLASGNTNAGAAVEVKVTGGSVTRAATGATAFGLNAILSGSTYSTPQIVTTATATASVIFVTIASTIAITGLSVTDSAGNAYTSMGTTSTTNGFVYTFGAANTVAVTWVQVNATTNFNYAVAIDVFTGTGIAFVTGNEVQATGTAQNLTLTVPNALFSAASVTVGGFALYNSGTTAESITGTTGTLGNKVNMNFGVPVAASPQWEMWGMGDTGGLQATSPFFLKIEYGTGSTVTNPQLWLTLGTKTDGAGNLASVLANLGTRVLVQAANPGTGGATAYECDFAGGNNWFACTLWRNSTGSLSRIFALDRSYGSTGSQNGNYATLFTAGYNLVQQQSVSAYGMNPWGITTVEGHWASLFPKTVTSSVVNGNTMISPAYPLVGLPDNPPLCVMMGLAADWAEAAAGGGTPSFTISIYGGTNNHPYLFTKSTGIGNVGSTQDFASYTVGCPAIRWE